MEKQETKKIFETKDGFRVDFSTGSIINLKRPYKFLGCTNAYGFSVFNRQNHLVQSHRFVMECYIGRPLEKREHIRHLDGNKTNNAINNLEIYTAKPKPKQRYRGVIMNSSSSSDSESTWSSELTVNRQKIHLGVFPTEKAAAKAFLDKANELGLQGVKIRIYQLNDDEDDDVDVEGV
jgi:HNH endonuclease